MLLRVCVWLSGGVWWCLLAYITAIFLACLYFMPPLLCTLCLSSLCSWRCFDTSFFLCLFVCVFCTFFFFLV